MERQKAEEREADRERKREKARRAKEAGPEAIRKEKYFGALSKAPPCNPDILHFLRHVRFTQTRGYRVAHATAFHCSST